jgi:hypothetical protein
MKTRTRHLLSICVGVLSCSATMPLTVQSGEPSSVYMQELTVAKAAKKVATVLWTRRADHYTLQVVFPKESAPFFGYVPNYPPIKMWLLSADGSAMSASRTPVSGGDEKASSSSEITYSVSHSAGHKVVAAVLRIDGEYFVEPIAPLPED